MGRPISTTDVSLYNHVHSSGGNAAGSRLWSAYANSTAAPLLIDDYVFEVNYGPTTGGWSITRYFRNNQRFSRTVLPIVGGGSSSTAWSFPLIGTYGWGNGLNWPSLLLDMKATTSSQAVIWCRAGDYAFKILMNRSSGAITFQKIGSLGGNGWDRWKIIATDGDDIYLNLSNEDNNNNRMGSVKVYKQTYVPTSQAFNYSTKYLQDNRMDYHTLSNISRDDLDNLDPNHQHNTYEIVLGVNDLTGRVYIHTRGHSDMISVWQIQGSHSSGYYKAFIEGLHSSMGTYPTSSHTYRLNYVKSFMAPSHGGYSRGDVNTTTYQVQFDPAGVLIGQSYVLLQGYC